MPDGRSNIAAAQLSFFPLRRDLVSACGAFNDRLRGAGASEFAVFDCTPNREHESRPPPPMEVERYVAVDAAGRVRGAYALRWQHLWLRGERLPAAHYGFPVSEGVVDRRYAMVGAALMRDAVRRCPHLYTLGADGRSGNVFGIGRHLGWVIADVNFLFRIVNGGRFLRRLPQVRRHTRLRPIADALAMTGLAGLGAAVLHSGCALRNFGSASLRQSSGVAVEEVAGLGAAADEVWSRACGQYAVCVVRDSAHVEPAFPAGHRALHRLVVRHRGAIVGWCVVMSENLSRLRRYLGDVAPGLIVDAFGDTAHAREVIKAAVAYLIDKGVDVVLTNTSHRSWLTQYRRVGFIERPSQFPLIVSRSLAGRIGDLAAAMPQIHMSRGDGDGVHYLH